MFGLGHYCRVVAARSASAIFTEQGYDATTVAQIAERAGVTKSTFFRRFPGKRELLVAGQGVLSGLPAEGIAEAPGARQPARCGRGRARGDVEADGPDERGLGPRLKAAVAASAELQERAALKSAGLAAAMTDALQVRGVPDLIAHAAGEIGVLAFKRGFSEWLEADHDPEGGLAPYTAAALEDLQAASASLS